MASATDTEQSKLMQKHLQYNDDLARELDKDNNSNNAKEMLEKASIRTIVTGYLLLLLVMGMYTVAVISAQITGGKNSMFEINFFSFGLQTILAIIFVVFWQLTLRVAKKDLHKFIIAIICNYCARSAFFIAAVILPVGNMDGVYGGSYILFTTCVDLYRKHISKPSVAASTVACVGLVMLTQLWKTSEDATVRKIAPCDYMYNHSLMLDIKDDYSNSSKLDTISMKETDWTGFLISYGLVVSAALSATVANNVYRSLMQSYSLYSVLFWAGLAQCFVSAILMTGKKYLYNGHLSLPTGALCLGFTIVLILSVALLSLFGNVVYRLLPISKVAIATPIATVSLYFIQRTLFKEFHPGNKNAVEIIGIVFICCAGVLSPVIAIIFERQ